MPFAAPRRLAASSLIFALMTSAAFAQTIAEVARQDTVIFENVEGRVAIPGNMNPYIAGQNLDSGVWQATQESLFVNNLESGELEPWLAESASFNADSTQLTIKLRPGIKWSDGVPFTSADVAFTIDMLKANAGLAYSADMNSWVASVATPDDLTVVIDLTKPNPRFVMNYFGVRIFAAMVIAPKHVWEGVDPLTFTNYDLDKGWPLGTGPYRLVRSTETETVFDRRDDWWAAETGFHALPEPLRAIWTGVGTEDARAAMAVNNQLDAMWVMSRSTFEIAHQRNAGIVGWTADVPYAYLDACPRMLYLNDAAAPFDQVAVRKALNNAINREQIAQIAFEGMTEPSGSLFPPYARLAAFLERNAPLFAADPVIDFNLDKSAALMTGAGFTRGDDGLWRGADGQTISFTMITPAGEADMLKMGPVIAAQLKAAGFDASFRPVEQSVYYTDVSTGTATAYIRGVCGSVTDPYDSFDLFHGRRAAPIGQPADGPFASRFANPEFDAAVDAMATMSPDDPAYAALADTALKVWTENLPAIPLVQARLLTPFNTTYWTNWPTAENNYFQPGHWWLSGDQILINLKHAAAQ